MILTVLMVTRKRLLVLIPVILTCAVLVLSSCGNALKFKNDGNTGNLIDEANGRYYIYCGSYLRAAEIKAGVYAKGDGKPKEQLHEITGIDPAKWLSENISSMAMPLLFREQSEEEPTLEDFGTDIIHITMTDEITLSMGAVTDKEDIDAIVSDYVNNEKIPLPEYISENITFYFESEKYKGIYYVLQYFVDDKNNSYLYDKWTKRCVSCSVNIF